VLKNFALLTGSPHETSTVFDATLADNPGDGLVMLVLTVANCSYEDSRAEVDRLEKAVGRWVRRRWFRGCTARLHGRRLVAWSGRPAKIDTFA